MEVISKILMAIFNLVVQFIGFIVLFYALFRSPLHLHPQQQEQYSLRHSIIRYFRMRRMYSS